jgi:hypothetical protein
MLFCPRGTSAGETVHSLKSAEEMRGKLLKMYQKIDLLSNSIMMHGSGQQAQTQISNEQMRLQKNIRVHAINYLKEYSFKLTQLPSIDEYEKLKEQKRKLLVEDLEREKREQQSDVYVHNNSRADGGWIPSCATVSQDKHMTTNPIEIQINIVKKYLSEAKKDGRLEEVKILEKNLSELYSL